MSIAYYEAERLIRRKKCLRHPDKVLVVQIDRASREYAPWCVSCGKQGYNGPALGKEDAVAERMWHMVQEQGLAKTYQGIPVLARLNKEDLRRWIAPKASDMELEVFLRFCLASQLNPFARDVYLIPFEDKRAGITRHAIVVGLQAYLKKAALNPLYQSYQSGLIVLRGGRYEQVPGTAMFPGDQLFGAWCRVYKKGAPEPFAHTVALKDWNKGSNLWADKPQVMIEVTAIRQAIRRAFTTEFGPLEGQDQVEGLPVEVGDREAVEHLVPELPASGAIPDERCSLHGTILSLNSYKNRMGHVVEGQRGPKGGKVWCYGEDTPDQVAETPSQVVSQAQDAPADSPADPAPVSGDIRAIGDLLNWGYHTFGIGRNEIAKAAGVSVDQLLKLTTPKELLAAKGQVEAMYGRKA